MLARKTLPSDNNMQALRHSNNVNNIWVLNYEAKWTTLNNRKNKHNLWKGLVVLRLESVHVCYSCPSYSQVDLLYITSCMCRNLCNPRVQSLDSFKNISQAEAFETGSVFSNWDRHQPKLNDANNWLLQFQVTIMRQVLYPFNLKSFRMNIPWTSHEHPTKSIMPPHPWLELWQWRFCQAGLPRAVGATREVRAWHCQVRSERRMM